MAEFGDRLGSSVEGVQDRRKRGLETNQPQDLERCAGEAEANASANSDLQAFMSGGHGAKVMGGNAPWQACELRGLLDAAARSLLQRIPQKLTTRVAGRVGPALPSGRRVHPPDASSPSLNGKAAIVQPSYETTHGFFATGGVPQREMTGLRGAAFRGFWPVVIGLSLASIVFTPLLIGDSIVVALLPVLGVAVGMALTPKDARARNAWWIESALSVLVLLVAAFAFIGMRQGSAAWLGGMWVTNAATATAGGLVATTWWKSIGTAMATWGCLIALGGMATGGYLLWVLSGFG